MLSLQTFLQQNQQAVQQLAGNNKIFIHPNIPHAKLRGAIASYLDGVEPQEVLILVDNTLMGGAREGLAITGKGVFFKETPFDGVTYHVLEHVTAIGCDGSLFGGTKVTFNYSSTIDFNGPDRKSIMALVLLLNDYLQQRQKAVEKTPPKDTSQQSKHSSQHQHEPDAITDGFERVIPMIDILLHFAFMPHNDFDEKNAEYIWTTLGEHIETKEHALILKSRVHLYPRPTLSGAIQQFLSFKPDQGWKEALIVAVFGSLQLNDFSDHDSKRWLQDVGHQLGFSPAQIVMTIKSFIDEVEHDEDYDHNDDENQSDEQVEWACNILEIKTNQINRDTVTQAYRLKMKDYHPDKYQSLPEPIMRMLHEKAQELNRAKDILAELY